MICWRVIRIVTGKEAVVNRALLRRGLETYLPMEIRSYRPSRHTKRRVCVEVPLIPRVLFVALPSEAPSLSNHRYVTGLQRDAFGELVVIPHWQMVSFMMAHHTWLEEARRKAKSGTGGHGRPKKRKWTPLAAPGALQTIMTELFGVPVEEDLTEPEFHGKRLVRYA